jgi:hypothetical protein
MNTETKNLLKRVLAQQVVLYKKLDFVQRKLSNESYRAAPLEIYADELGREADELIS